MLRVWLDIPVATSGAASALTLARRHPAFVVVGVSAGSEVGSDVANAMLAAAAPFHLVTTGPLTSLARLLAEHPKVRVRWQRVVCTAGQLETPAEANVLADRAAAEVVLRELAPRVVGVEAARSVPWSEGKACAPLALLSLLRPDAFDLQLLRVLVEKDGRLRLTDDGCQVEYALSAKWEVLEAEMGRVMRSG